MRTRRLAAAAFPRLASAALPLIFALGCWEQVDREWFAQMKEQPAVQHLENRAPWMPPEHTIPVGASLQRLAPDDPMLLENNPLNSPVGRAFTNPVAASAESVARGRKMYLVYCGVCHGPEGMPIPTEVPVAARLMAVGALPLPLASTVGFTDGQLFTKITYGKPQMPAYPQIAEEDRWHIVNYLRSKFGAGPAQ